MRKGIVTIVGAVLCWTPIAWAQNAPQSPAPVADPIALAKVAAVQRHVDAYRSGSLDRFVATFTRDARVVANGMTAEGHDEIRALYAMNFAPGAPSIRIVDSGVNGGFVFLSIGYVFDNAQEMCCSYTEHEIDLASGAGKISFLNSSG